jgi:DNA-binding NarL/FixJ family response regulator
VIEGLACANGEPTAWCAVGGEVAATAVRLWKDSHAISRPLPVPAAGLLTVRQVVVARAMCRAVPDQRLALQLGISLRSVEREVAAVIGYVEASCRGEAVLRLLGRHRGSPVPHQRRRVG